MTVQTDLSLRKIFSLSAIYGITPVIDKALSFLLLPLFTHYLSPQKYGSLVLLYTAAFLLRSLVFLGFADTLLKTYWDYKGEERRRSLGTAWLFNLGMNAIIIVPLCFFSGPLASALFNNKAITLLMILMLMNISLSSQSLVPYVALRANERKYSIMTVNLLSIGTRVGLTGVFLVWLHLDIVGIFLADLCANIVTLIVYLPRLVKEISFSFEWKYLKHILTLSPLQFVVEILAWVISMSDRWIIQHVLHSSTDVGIYGIGYAFGSGMIFLVGPIFGAWRPHLYAVSSTDRSEYAHQMGLFFPYFFALCCAVALGLSVLSPDVINILTPSAYHRAGTIVAPIVAGYLLATLSNYFLPTFFIHHKMSRVVYAYIISAIVSLTANFIFVKKFGISGAAVSVILAYGVMLVMICLFSGRIVRIDVHPTILVVIMIISLLVMIALHYLKSQSVYGSLIIKSIALCTLYCLGGWYILRRRQGKSLKPWTL